LIEVDAEAEVRGHRTQVLGAAGELDEIVLEQFDAVETRRGNGLQLLAQGTAQRNGRNRSVHVTSSTEPGAVLSNALQKCSDERRELRRLLRHAQRGHLVQQDPFRGGAGRLHGLRSKSSLRGMLV